MRPAAAALRSTLHYLGMQTDCTRIDSGLYATTKGASAHCNGFYIAPLYRRIRRKETCKAGHKEIIKYRTGQGIAHGPPRERQRGSAPCRRRTLAAAVGGEGLLIRVPVDGVQRRPDDPVAS